jgi:hypothetical protein
MKLKLLLMLLQVSVSNEVFQHLGQPRFMLCPTQYCAARATPNVQNSEYLNTLGSKLASEIDIMWTGKESLFLYSGTHSGCNMHYFLSSVYICKFFFNSSVILDLILRKMFW